MRRPHALAATLLFSLLPLARAQQPDAAPVDPDATPAARALLREIDSISGHATLDGEHNYPNTVSRYSDRILELTGSYPAVFGQDFGFSGDEDKDSTLSRPSMIKEVTRQYRKGAVIALTWHAVRPTEDEPVTFHDSVQGHLTDYEWQQLLTPGTELHTRWEHQVDRIAGYLHELQDAGVPVLFRPYHEMNGNWFWWGGRPGPHGSQELYRQLFDRYVHVHHLHNLVWVWNVNAPSVNAGPVDQYLPGPGFADIYTLDVYGPFEQRYYESMTALAGPHKPIALAEVGHMPSLAELAQQPRWAYFMMWSGSAEDSNSPQELQTVFHAPNIVNRGDPRLPLPAPSSLQPTPVDEAATGSTRALLRTLAAAGFTPGSPSPAAAPALVQFSLDPGTPETARRTLQSLEESHKVPVLRWTPASPAGNGQQRLSDFEWNELLLPGNSLHMAWLAEVHQFAAQLAALHAREASLVLDPLPQPNSTSFWWSDRPGPEGSQLLLNDLRSALDQAGVHSVLWTWEPALAPPPTPSANRVPLAAFSPGPSFFDLVWLPGAAPEALHGYRGYMLLGPAGMKPILLGSATP